MKIVRVLFVLGMSTIVLGQEPPKPAELTIQRIYAELGQSHVQYAILMDYSNALKAENDRLRTENAALKAQLKPKAEEPTK